MTENAELLFFDTFSHGNTQVSFLPINSSNQYGIVTLVNVAILIL